MFKWHGFKNFIGLYFMWCTHHKDKACDWEHISDMAREYEFGSYEHGHLSGDALKERRYVITKNISYWTWATLYV